MAGTGGGTGGTGVDEDRGFGQAGAPPPPPGPAGDPAGGAAPSAARRAAASSAPSGWGAGARCADRTQGWVPPGEVPAAWGAASPSAQVGWDRPPSGSNGCLKACLIVGGILVVVVIIGAIALSIFVGRIVEQVQENPDAVFGGECQLVSSFEVSDALGADVEVLALEGFADGTMGAILDKRLLPDATDCWILGDGTAGRIAVVTPTRRRCSGTAARRPRRASSPRTCRGSATRRSAPPSTSRVRAACWSGTTSAWST